MSVAVKNLVEEFAAERAGTSIAAGGSTS